jgi:hypothetical protein
MWPKNTTRIRRSRIKSCRTTLSVGVAVLILFAAVTQGQTRSYYGCCQPPIQLRRMEPPPTRVRLTYGGRVYFSFPNYDVMVSGAPRNVTELIQGTGTGGPTVISKNAEGMRWDGTGYFLHPAYPSEYVTRYHYKDRIVGEPRKQWPETKGRRPVDQRGRLSQAPPTVTQTQSGPTAPTYTVPDQNTTMRFLPAPWVVVPPVKSQGQPTPAEKAFESPYATSFSPIEMTTSANELQQKVNAVREPSHEQGQTVRRVRKTPVDCRMPTAWASPECADYRRRNRKSTNDQSRPTSLGATPR